MKVNPIICINCGACASVCPVNAIEVLNNQVNVLESCTNCGLCEKTCPLGAIKIE
ncbi:MAG: 4Fe-4S binding protein [Hadesarchaea archaeon]|nr:4Fe-4S binding protein [Hadesarchaea archaeon]